MHRSLWVFECSLWFLKQWWGWTLFWWGGGVRGLPQRQATERRVLVASSACPRPRAGQNLPVQGPMCSFSNPQTGYSRCVHRGPGLWGWSLLIVAQDHESATCQATLWWGIGEISLNHSRTILVYHWKQLFFSFLDFKTLRDVHLRASWWTITTPAKEHLSASLMWQGWGQNVDVCLSGLFFLIDPLVRGLLSSGLSLFESRCWPGESQTPAFCQYMFISSAGVFRYYGPWATCLGSTCASCQ